MKVVEELEGLVSSKWEIFKSIISLIKLEARLASISAAHVLVGILFLFIIVITTWLMLMALIGYGIFVLYPSPALAITSTLLINLVIVGVVLKHVLDCANSMTFEKSRRFLFADKETGEHDLPQTTDARDSNPRKRIVISEDRKL
jgi:hypothetical protein